MNKVKLLCVLALGLCASLAVGASSAFATELCADPNCAEVYESGQAIEVELPAEAVSELKIGSSGTVTCKESAVVGETTAESGEPLSAEVTGLTFGECEMVEGEVSCTVTAVNLPYDAEIEETGEGNGVLTAMSGGSGNPGSEITCGSLTCTGTATSVPFDLVGGSPAYLSAVSVKFTLSGSFPCALLGTAEWTVEYVVAAPMPVQAGATPTVLCTAAPDGKGVCPKGKQFAGGKVFGEQASGSPTFQTHPGGARIVTCKKASFEGDYDKLGMGKVEKMTFVGDGVTACASNFPATFKTKKDPPVTVTLQVLPFTSSSFKYKPLGGAHGEFSFGPTFKPDNPVAQPTTRLELYVEATILCTYRWNGAPKGTTWPFLVSNGGASATTLALSAVWINRSESPKEGVCPTYLQQFTNLALTRTEVNKEKNIYVAQTVEP